MKAESARAQQSAATRARLLRLGLERFPVRGYAATTIDDLVRDSGISRPTWYLHFGDKASYFLEVLQFRGTPRGPWWELARDTKLRTLEEVLEEAQRVLREGDPDYVDWVLLHLEFWRSERGNEAAREALSALYESYLTEIEQFLQVLRERGLVPEGGSTRTQAASLLALMEGLRSQEWLYAATVARSFPQIAAALLRGADSIR